MIFNPEERDLQKTDTFEAQIIVINHPNGIKANFTPVIDVHTAHVAC